MMKPKTFSVLRKAVQALWSLITNAHLSGFRTGRIYTGRLKSVCVPGMNCYACPGALGACPIGAMQAVWSARRPKFAFYVLGYLAAVGIFAGRFICGWLCIFGLVQELLYMLPLPKLTVPERTDKILRYAKYAFLGVFVVLLPTVLRDELGVSLPYFCKWICPVGMLEGGVPLAVLDEGIRAAAHFLYAWKLSILIAVALLSAVINRPFCKYICPLGAFYSFFQRISFLQLGCDRSRCISCGKCAKACKMQVDPVSAPNSSECIRCGECVRGCPKRALHFSFAGKTGNAEKASE